MIVRKTGANSWIRARSKRQQRDIITIYYLKFNLACERQHATNPYSFTTIPNPFKQNPDLKNDFPNLPVLLERVPSQRQLLPQNCFFFLTKIG